MSLGAADEASAPQRADIVLGLNGGAVVRVSMGVRRVGIYSVWACFALSGRMGAADSSTDVLIERVEQHYNRARTLSVQFVEEYSIQGRHRAAETGTLTLRKQGKMRWDYVQPAGKLFVSDGKIIYLYTATDNRVEEIPLKDTEDMRAPLAFLLGHLELKKEFQHFTLRPEQGETWLEATARSAKTPYGQVAMRVDGRGAISRLTVVGRDESRLEFALSREQVNPAVNDSLFSFKIPPGAEVVHALQYTAEDR